MDLLLLTRLRSLDRLALAALRVFVGAFMIYGVWDNIVDPARMTEFVGFLTSIKCPMPELAAPLSVWAQFIVGVLLIPGLMTRWAGLVLAFNFIVAVLLLGPTGATFRDLFPPAILIFVGAVFATAGAGMLSVDDTLERRLKR